MRKTLVKSLIAGFLFYCLLIPSLFFSVTPPASAAIAQKANTIVLEVGSSTKDDLKDLQYGEGKLFKKIAKVVERLKDSGEVDADAQPVIIVVQKKKSSDF